MNIKSNLINPDTPKKESSYCFKKSINVNGIEISLSMREFQCLELLSHGKRTKEISTNLKISTRTVESYIKIIKDKLKPTMISSIADVYWNYFRTPPNYLSYTCTIPNSNHKNES